MKIDEHKLRNIISLAILGPAIEYENGVVPVYQPYQETGIDKLTNIPRNLVESGTLGIASQSAKGSEGQSSTKITEQTEILSSTEETGTLSYTKVVSSAGTEDDKQTSLSESSKSLESLSSSKELGGDDDVNNTRNNIDTVKSEEPSTSSNTEDTEDNWDISEWGLSNNFDGFDMPDEELNDILTEFFETLEENGDIGEDTDSADTQNSSASEEFGFSEIRSLLNSEDTENEGATAKSEGFEKQGDTMSISNSPISRTPHTSSIILSPLTPQISSCKEFIKAVKKFGNHSPNEVQAIRIGTDAVVKNYFDGSEYRWTFGREGKKLVEETIYLIGNKQMGSLRGLLAGMITPKMSNLEEIYIDGGILRIAGMNVKGLAGLQGQELVGAINSKKFCERLFGISENTYRLFGRLKVVALGDKVATVQDFKGNWRASRNKKTGEVELFNPSWVVEDKLYAKDNELYKFVRNYYKNFEEA